MNLAVARDVENRRHKNDQTCQHRALRRHSFVVRHSQLCAKKSVPLAYLTTPTIGSRVLSAATFWPKMRATLILGCGSLDGRDNWPL